MSDVVKVIDGHKQEPLEKPVIVMRCSCGGPELMVSALIPGGTFSIKFDAVREAHMEFTCGSCGHSMGLHCIEENEVK